MQPVEFRGELKPNLSFSKALTRWFWICAIGAAPSFFWGVNFAGPGNIGALFAGIGVFVVAYASLDSSTSVYGWRRNNVIQSALVAAFTTRMIFTLMIPFSIAVDAACGFISIQMVESVYPSLVPDDFNQNGIGTNVSFFAAFVLTLVQGLVLNAVVFVVAAIFASIHSVVLLLSGKSIGEQS